MNERHEKAWKELAKRARQGERHVISGEAAERLLRALPDEGMSEETVDAIVSAVVDGRTARVAREPAAGIEGRPAPRPEMEEDVLQLNRNKGGEDADAESLLEELRREALEDDENKGDEEGAGREPRD